MRKHTYIFIAAILLAAVSCTRDTEMAPDASSNGYGLLLRTEIDGMTTKAAGASVEDDSNLQENVVKTLDVYIYGTFKGDAAESVKGFHLNATEHYSAGTWMVSPDWRDAGLVAGNTYKLYVAANSSKVKTSADSGTTNTTKKLGNGASDMTITTLDDLGNAIEFDYNPSEQNYKEDGTTPDTGTKPFWGSHNDDGVNPAWLDVHKKYTSTENVKGSDATSERYKKADRYFTHEKTFLMNGTSAEFTPASNSGEITVTPAVTLSRAASKISVNVSFSPGFLTKLHDEKGWNLLIGEPHWRFYNFAFNTPIFSDLTQADTYNPKVSWLTSAADMIGYEGIDGNDLIYGSGTDKAFSFSTYSYPLTWTAATADKDAPAIIISVGYRDDSDTSIAENLRPVTYQSYKIPVVNPDEAIYSLDRNKIYTINATISSEGSTLVTDAFEINAKYEILKWGDDATASAISDRDNSYIDVIPDAIAETTDATDVILRGNGEQTFRLHVLKPDTKNFSIAYYGISGASQSNPFAQTATPTDYPLTGNYTDESGHTYTGCAATGASVPYYINLNGTIRNTIGSSGIQNCFVKDGDDIIIISEALPNKGVKYMKIRVFLDGYKTTAGKYMDVNIRHYPTDAIIPIEGRWSSRQSACLVAPDNYKIENSKVIHGPEDYTFTETVATRSDYDAYDGYKRWEWVVCDKTTYDSKPEDERSVEIGIIPRETYAAHTTGTNGGTVNGTEEPGYKKHVSIYGTGTAGNTGGDYGWYFYKNDGQTSYHYHTVLADMSTIQSATTEADAFKSNHADEQSSYVYYWGEGVAEEYDSQKQLADLDNYDYYTRTGSGSSWNPYYYHAMRYPTRKRVYYTGYIYKYKKFYTIAKSLDSNAPRWINWDNDLNNNTYESGPKYYQGAQYWGSNVSKVFYSKIITDGVSGGKGTVSYKRPASGTTGSVTVNNTTGAGDWCIYNGYSSGSAPSTLLPTKDVNGNKNRYMYVLQQNETSNEYTIGRPILNPDTMMSSDNVVSPAFMTASQLAYENRSIGTPTASYAALHCASYLEVASDGTYFSGWRLPTRNEIMTMIKYQGNKDGEANLVPGSPVSNDDRVMTAVLTATYYIALDGTWIASDYRTTGDTTYSIRCVRDLTPEEIEKLNN